MRRKWTDQEMNYVKQNYFALGTKVCSIDLKRSRVAVGLMAGKLNVRRPKRHHSVMMVCPVCKKEFYRAVSLSDRKACSSVCGYKLRKNIAWNKGKIGVTKMSESTKEKHRLRMAARKEKYGTVNSPEIIRRITAGIRKWHLTHKVVIPEATREKISQALYGRKRVMPIQRNNPSYPRMWQSIRKRILERDGYQCVRCGKKDGKLCVHHLVPRFYIQNNTNANLITVCPSCHRREEARSTKLSKILIKIDTKAHNIKMQRDSLFSRYEDKYGVTDRQRDFAI